MAQHSEAQFIPIYL